MPAITNAQRRRNKKQGRRDEVKPRRAVSGKTTAPAKKASVAKKPFVQKKTASSQARGNGKSQKARKPTASSMANVNVGQAYYFPTDVIRVNADQPRDGKDYDYINEDLAPSIERRGQSNPGKVYMIPGARGKVRFELVGGEHRYWACERLGIPFWAVLVTVKDAEDLFVQSFEDNEGTMQYNDREKAAAIVRMRDKYKMSWADICDRMGGSNQLTAKNFYNLGKMPTSVQNMVAEKLIPKGVVTELMAVGKPHIVSTAERISGMKAEDARHEIRRVQDRHGRQSSDSVPRKRVVSDDRRVFEGAVSTARSKLQRLSDRFQGHHTKAMLASSMSPDANPLLLSRLDQVITNALHLQAMAFANLPPKFTKKVQGHMNVSVKVKLAAAILASGDLPATDVAKLKEILEKIK